MTINILSSNESDGKKCHRFIVHYVSSYSIQEQDTEAQNGLLEASPSAPDDEKSNSDGHLKHPPSYNETIKMDTMNAEER